MARDGIGTCRYRYRNNLCAHGSIDSKECKGEENCSFGKTEYLHHHGHECSKEQWFGLYCAKYQRFYCAGSENCSSFDQYITHLNIARQSQLRF